MMPMKDSSIAIVGGCGFIGSNLADSLLASGERVLILDNLSRSGVERNLDWLMTRHRKRLAAEIVDIRDFDGIAPLLGRSKAVFHFAAQTAVTTSLTDPFDDFETNARGTLNVLEAVRRAQRRIPVVFASTNKVYGCLNDLETVERAGRHEPADAELAAHGIDEERPLDLRTPYGCSKGVADQYVLDYAASFGIPTAVLRMSCIYGPHQFGTEDQGWVAHFLIRALAGETITIFGDGRQVRDILHVSDAVAAYKKVLRHIDRFQGHPFNLGGGPANAVSLNEVLDEIATVTGRRIEVRHEQVRTGDQPYFVADTRRLQSATGWSATMGWRDGIRDLMHWLAESRADAAPPSERAVA